MNVMLPPSAARVQGALDAAGVALAVVEFSESTRTAADAAAAIGCTVAQIAKSLVFRGKTSGEPVLVVASGVNRVDEKAVGRIVGEKIGRADVDYVREMTGYAIGGIPPVGHARAIRTLIDEDLLALQELWAAAGTPHAVFRLTPSELLAITGGQVAAVKVA